MGAEDFIALDASQDSDHNSFDNGLQTSNNEIKDGDDEVNLGQTQNQLVEDVQLVESVTMVEEVNAVGQERDDGCTVTVTESVKMVEKVNAVEVGQEMDDGCTVTLMESTTTDVMVDQSPMSGVKRARMEHVDEEPSVRVIFNSLTRESKRKLMELMQQWSEWQSKCQPPKESSTEVMENGEETYYPAINVGSKKPSAVTFWVGIQSSKGDVDYELNNDSVPLYDRGCTLGLSLTDDSTNSERVGALEASRCFNCGSYNHALKECPKPRDNAAINNARKQHTSKRNQTPGSRSAVRYYEKPSGKYDDLKAGVLGPEARESLGIGEYDPPPWLHRMREMGYPPGYLDEVEDEDQPSGITIFDGEEKMDIEEGELPEEVKPKTTAKKMTVEFPGINAPIPENANTQLWSGVRPGTLQRPTRALEPQRGSYPDQRWSGRDDPPPGTERGHVPSTPGYSPRYNPYDQNVIARSPVLGRSLSDRGRRPYENSPANSPHSPFPYPGQHAQSPLYNSPIAVPELRSLERAYNSSTDGSSHHSRERHEHRRHHRR